METKPNDFGATSLYSLLKAGPIRAALLFGLLIGGALCLIWFVMTADKRSERAKERFEKQIEDAGNRAREEFLAPLKAADKRLIVRVTFGKYEKRLDCGSLVVLVPEGTKSMSPRGLDPRIANLEYKSVRQTWLAIGGDVGITDEAGCVSFENLSGGNYTVIVISANADVSHSSNHVAENKSALNLYFDNSELAERYAIKFPQISLVASRWHEVRFYSETPVR